MKIHKILVASITLLFLSIAIFYVLNYNIINYCHCIGTTWKTWIFHTECEPMITFDKLNTTLVGECFERWRSSEFRGLE
jgi:hypothetical protein